MSEEAEKTIDFSGESDISDVAAQAIADPAILAALIENLGGGSRRVRQFCAAALNAVSEERVDLLKPYVAQLSDALFRPEAQTRWEILAALTSLAAVDPDCAAKAFEGAEESLYDEESGMLRYTAFRYFAKLAAAGPDWCRKVWPLLDEALQCYHGDPEFAGMLDAMVDLAQTDIDAQTRSALCDRMKFDAQAGKSPLAYRAQHIIELCKKA